MIPRKKAGDYELYVKQFMNDLNLQIENTNKIINATKMNAQTGYTPTIMEDTRTTREKLQDTVKLKQDITKGLKEITDGTEITQILSQITDGELIFLAQHLSEIVEKLKPRYKYGIPAMEFLDYLREYIDTYTAAHGVDFGGNTGLLNRIETLINRLPQQADLTAISRFLNDQIHFMGEHLERQIKEAAAANDEAQVDRFRRIMLEIQTSHTVLLREMQEYKGMLEGFETSLEMIETNAGSSNKAELDEIIDRLKDLPDMTSIMTKLNDIQRSITTKDYSTLLKRYDELIHDLDRYKEALNTAQTKANIHKEYDFKPKAWSWIEKRKFDDLLSYLQMLDDIIELNSLKTISDPELAQASNEISDIIRLTSATFFDGMTMKETAEDLNLRGGENKTPYFINRFLRPRGINTKKDFIIWLKNQGLEASIDRFNAAMISRDISIRNEEETKTAEPIKGKGLSPGKKTYFSNGRVITGRGVKPRKRYDKIQPGDIDYSMGVKPTPKFIPLGKYVVNHHRLLNDNFLSVKTVSGAGVHGLPPTRISNKFSEVIDTMLKNKNPSFDTLNDLTKDEKEYLYKLAKKSNILDRFTIPTPDKSKEDKELHEFEVLKGQIMAGNDNKDLIKKFKLTLVKLTNTGLIAKNQSNAILTELATLGY